MFVKYANAVDTCHLQIRDYSVRHLARVTELPAPTPAVIKHALVKKRKAIKEHSDKRTCQWC
jgi:hypothetical protein